MRIRSVFTYEGGPLDGQTAQPTSQRGKQYTTYRTETGAALRASTGDRWARAANNGGQHPGWYSRDEVTAVDVDNLTMHGVYRWRPANNDKAGDR